MGPNYAHCLWLMWLLGALSIWRDAFLSLDAGGRWLGPASMHQPMMTPHVNEALPFLRSGWMGGGVVWG